MKEFYQNLQKKRSEKGITLEEINQKTRLPMAYLKALEEGRLDDLPDGYERIYLRRYVKEIGLAEAEVLHDFDLLTGRLAPGGVESESSAEPAPESAVFGEEKETTFKSNSAQDFVHSLNLDRIHKFAWIGFAIIAVLGASYFVWLKYDSHKSNQALEVKEISLQELVENFEEKDTLSVTDEAPAVEGAAVTAEIMTASSGADVNVLLNALKRTWIREIKDGKDTTDYILPRGIKRTIKAGNTVQLRFGVADGVEVWLNQKNLGVMGKEDEVLLYLLLNKEGVQGKRVRKVQPENKTPTSTTIPAAPPIRGQ